MLKSLLTVVSYSSGDSGPRGLGWIRVQGSGFNFKFQVSNLGKTKTKINSFGC